MLTLTLIRHAKSCRADGSLTDAARPLAARGVADGPVIAAWLAASVTRPDVVLVSTAERTRATWTLLADAWGTPPRCAFDDGLYMASADVLFGRIANAPAPVQHLAVVGHNSGLYDLALGLTGAASVADRSALQVKFPTAGVVVLAFDAPSWSAVQYGAGTLLHFVSPGRIAGAA